MASSAGVAVCIMGDTASPGGGAPRDESPGARSGQGADVRVGKSVPARSKAVGKAAPSDDTAAARGSGNVDGAAANGAGGNGHGTRLVIVESPNKARTIAG